MHTAVFTGQRTIILVVICILNLFGLLSAQPVRGAGTVQDMLSYCSEPPFAAAGVRSNLLLLIDNSSSMYDLAYTDQSSYCLDNSYRNDSSYGGYFDQKSIYSYDTVNSKFTPGASLPLAPCSTGSCAASNNYLYVEMAGVAPNRTVRVFKATGNFLNWLSMSKLDLEKQVLTGGKYLSGVLQAEMRGCQGKRFVKMIGDDAAITFAVHGPVFTDAGYTFQPSRGGATTIEIYDKPYHRVACLAAVDAWLKGNKDQVIAQANACMDVSTEVSKRGVSIPSAGVIFNRVMTDCYGYLVGQTPITAADTTLDGKCSDRYLGIFGNIVRATDVATLDGFCGAKLPHTPRPPSGSDSIGYLGKCLQGVTGKAFDGNCALNETLDYCNEIATPYVTDLPATTAGSNANVPGYILDAGISNLGNISGAFKARVAVGSPPTGLIQQFSDSINFGAMVFNADGISDGGKVISYINDPASPVGDHSTGLIAAIDGVTANAWTPLAESFYDAIGYFAHRSDLRLQAADFDTVNKPAPSKFNCQRNNVLIVSDGMSSMDNNSRMETLASLYFPAEPSQPTYTGQDQVNNCPAYAGSRSLDDLAWIAYHRNIKTFNIDPAQMASTDPPLTPDQSITTHVIFTGLANGASGECDPATLMQHTAARGGGIYAQVTDPGTLYYQFKAVLRQIADGTDSGTDASILTTGAGNGALYLREQYFPKKSFDDGGTSVSWIGELQSLWYYVDPFAGGKGGTASTIREDTTADLTLNLKEDRVVQFQGNESASLFYDANGDGASDDGSSQTVTTDGVQALWRAGIALWQRDPDDRTIYTQTNGSALTPFVSLKSDPNAVQLLQATDAAEAQRIVSYVTGVDYPVGGTDPTYRNRTVTVAAGKVAGVAPGRNVWKLGDIISSTPKVQSPAALNSYHLAAPSGYGDGTYGKFIGTDPYQSRGTVYAGANDGMLHAFTLGAVKTKTAGDVKATLEGNSGSGQGSADLGKEQWAFIPKNVLPYLTYLKEPVYQHLYLVDGSITLTDASIGDTNSGACVKAGYWNCPKEVATWRTVLIGGMGLGGAGRDPATACSDPTGNGGDCVPTPISDPTGGSGRLGYSSYFAMDVTDPLNPTLLWEFAAPDLGHSTSGPVVVRVGDSTLNGRWFVVFGSGPTGPVSNNQFLGHSNQELKFFVVDLRTGALITTIPTGISNGFAGSMIGGGIDVDRWKQSLQSNYQDDAVYAGYVALDPVLKTWTRGGVGRIMIDDLPKGTPPTDDKVRTLWHWSRLLGYDPASAPDDTTGPVTAGMAKLQDRRSHNLWLFFGSGRYYYRTASELDDSTGIRTIYGIKDPCYNNNGKGDYLDKSCSSPVCPGSPSADCITDQTGSISAVAKGWRIDLDPAGGSNGAERVITAPLSTTAGVVFFTTFQPSLAPCQTGNAYLWGVRYETGDAIPDGSIQGKALMQLSTGRVQEARFSGTFTDRGGRRGPAMTGKPRGVKVVSNSGLRPLKKIIHIQER